MEKLRYGEAGRNGVRPVVWTKKQLDFIRTRYKEGKSLRAIAAYFGLPTHSRITLICDEMGWTRSKRNSERAQFRQQMFRKDKKYIWSYLQPGYSAQMVARAIAADAHVQYKGDYANVLNAYVKAQGIQKEFSEVVKSKDTRVAHLKRWQLVLNRRLVTDYSTYERYLKAARAVTATVVWFNRHIKEFQYARYGFDIDHIFSIYVGYEQGVDLKIICHPCNLQAILPKNNRLKGNRCDITLKELKNRIRQFNAKYGDPFKLEK